MAMITRSKAAGVVPAKRKAQEEDIGPAPKIQKPNKADTDADVDADESNNNNNKSNDSDIELDSSDKPFLRRTRSRTIKAASAAGKVSTTTTTPKPNAAAATAVTATHKALRPSPGLTSQIDTTSSPKVKATPKLLPPFSMKTRSQKKKKLNDAGDSVETQIPATPPVSRPPSHCGAVSGVPREAGDAPTAATTTTITTATATDTRPDQVLELAETSVMQPPTPALTSEEPEPATQRRRTRSHTSSPVKKNAVPDLPPNGIGNIVKPSPVAGSISPRKRRASESPPTVNSLGLRSSRGIKRKRGTATTTKCFENDGEEVRQAKAQSDWMEPELADDKFLQRPAKTVKRRRLTTAPDTPLTIFVCGDGGSGELGLGMSLHEGQMPMEVETPRRNHLLDVDTVGVVDIACGKEHCVALTKDNDILTWGWNGDEALGRDTNHHLNGDEEPNEAEFIPEKVGFAHIEDDMTWAQVVATDCASFALTADGRVFGWGTFKFHTGDHGFSHGVAIQRKPAQIENLQDIIALAAGSQHVLALDAKCTVHSWGCNSHSQLGRRRLSIKYGKGSSASALSQTSCLRPKPVAKLPDPKSKAWQIACGSRHSFAIDQDGLVYAWGSNTMGQLGIQNHYDSGKACVSQPRLVTGLEGKCIAQMAAGRSHTVACTSEGQLLAWGQKKHNAVGMQEEDLQENKFPVVSVPTVLNGMGSIKAVAAGRQNSIAIDEEGLAYTFGRSKRWQTGQGTTEPDVGPKLVDCPELREMNVLFANGGEDFTVFAAVPRDG